MSIIALIAVSLGLAMDAFAVSITCGAIVKKQLSIKNLFKISAFFAIFQAIMPLLGWFLGQSFSTYIQEYDHWIAFFLLSFIGLRMIYESIKNKGDKRDFDPLNNKVLLYLAIATSIDALAIGVSLAFLEVSVALAVLMIGLVTFIVCASGVMIGKKGGQFFKGSAEIGGGIVLALIGTKILLEHLQFL